MRRFRIRQFGSPDWTYIEIKGDLADGLHAIIESGFWTWSSKLHVQTFEDGRWEDME